jgi:hypothetical protein
MSLSSAKGVVSFVTTLPKIFRSTMRLWNDRQPKWERRTCSSSEDEAAESSHGKGRHRCVERPPRTSGIAPKAANSSIVHLPCFYALQCTYWVHQGVFFSWESVSSAPHHKVDIQIPQAAWQSPIRSLGTRDPMRSSAAVAQFPPIIVL